MGKNNNKEIVKFREQINNSLIKRWNHKKAVVSNNGSFKIKNAIK